MSMMEQHEPKLLSQGAEGKVYESTFLSRHCVIKERVSKRYRVRELDLKINKQRLLQEVRCMVKCRKAGILTPSLFLVDQHKHTITMEFIEGRTLKDILRSEAASGYQGRCFEVAQKVGEAIGKMHDIDVVHGDLTTSNIMVRDADNQVVLIDFGLAQMKSVVEDRAVDLYVLERAFVSTHPGSEHLVAAILEAYRFSCRKGTPVLGKLEQVRQRGRKREMIG